MLHRPTVEYAPKKPNGTPDYSRVHVECCDWWGTAVHPEDANVCLRGLMYEWRRSHLGLPG